jgi:hypothetical protein
MGVLGAFGGTAAFFCGFFSWAFVDRLAANHCSSAPIS